MKPKTITTLAAALGLVTLAAANAAPLKVNTLGTKSQQVSMCADCNEKIACAKVGDYTIGFAADLEHPKTGTARVAAHVKDAAGNPVENAKVMLTLTMPDHKHGKKPLALKHTKHGRYVAGTTLGMTGAWKAVIEVTPASGDTIKQAFSFTK